MEQIEIIQYFKSLQDQICDGIAKADGQGTFKEDV
jgi:coproporphyrinogen III oxidase